MNHIELFAGCGGLCLGLSRAGFSLQMANELSPMAASSFAYNFFGEDLEKSTKQNHTLWLSSNYTNESKCSDRIRENPLNFPTEFPLKNSDLKPDGSNLSNSLIIGSIITLNKWLKKNKQAKEKLKNFNVDLVSGGPPCQSFSLAGLRKKDSPRNQLPYEFAKFVKLTSPKCVLLENVSGIMQPFKDGGVKYYAWFEVAKAFFKIKYTPIFLHINAKFTGVPQNRPRFIMIALRNDIYKVIKKTFNNKELELFKASEEFKTKINKKIKLSINDLTIHDLNATPKECFSLFNNTFLAPLVRYRNDNLISVKNAISDLSDNSISDKSEYVKNLSSIFFNYIKRPNLQITHNNRQKISDRVKERYYIYQVISKLSKEIDKEVKMIFSEKLDSLSEKSWDKLKDYSFIVQSKKVKFSSKHSFENYLKKHKTKKHSQRVLDEFSPAPAALSIPDDFCHYKDIRTLSAREMARIQSFPDQFEFKGKLTTGGNNRKFEVPIYTQIGNAVPPILGYALGLAIKDLLSRIKI